MTSASFSYPDFENVEFLKDHVQKVLNFYRGSALDPSGGFFHGFQDDGTLFDKDLRHIVSSCRFIFNFLFQFYTLSSGGIQENSSLPVGRMSFARLLRNYKNNIFVNNVTAITKTVFPNSIAQFKFSKYFSSAICCGCIGC